jgi:hypothetical protein
LWLPMSSSWNGRYVVTGGGGLSAGLERNLALPIARGYATAWTDGGLSLNRTIDAATGAWAIKRPGELNMALVKNFAFRSIHDTAALGKAVVEPFYWQRASFNYFSGCSTGGRQGYFAAEHYPADYDGIMANSPALNTPQVSPGDFWPSVVMANLGAPPQCVFSAYLTAITAACDVQHGVKDGLVSNPDDCKFNPADLVGSSVPCPALGGTGSATNITINTQHAQVVSLIPCSQPPISRLRGSRPSLCAQSNSSRTSWAPTARISPGSRSTGASYLPGTGWWIRSSPTKAPRCTALGSSRRWAERPKSTPSTGCSSHPRQAPVLVALVPTRWTPLARWLHGLKREQSPTPCLPTPPLWLAPSSRGTSVRTRPSCGIVLLVMSIALRVSLVHELVRGTTSSNVLLDTCGKVAWCNLGESCMLHEPDISWVVHMSTQRRRRSISCAQKGGAEGVNASSEIVYVTLYFLLQ